TDVVDGNYYTNAKDFTQHNLELQGMIVYEYKETSISGYPAKYIISSTDKDDFKAITVVFGDNTFSTMISSIYNAYDPEFEKSLIKILLSVKYDKNHIIHPFKNVNFMVDTTSTAFNHMRYSANTYDFSTGKVKANKSIESIIITPLFYNKAVSLEEISLMTINTNKQFGMYGFKEQHSSKFQNKGVDVLLKKGSCFVGTEKYYYHQLILAKNELMLLVRGMCAIEDTLTQQEISKFCELVELTE
ncbi:MAG: hypothetical protein MI922_25830, partial [Bacteroidales bacterium]|nr:hypothetical protein [Bacteroidales bacterium]